MDVDTEYPTINGTGTEDYFCGSYDFDTRKKNAAGVEEVNYTEYCTPYAGLRQVIEGDGHYNVSQRFGMYRWHITDPIRFEIFLCRMILPLLYSGISENLTIRSRNCQIKTRWKLINLDCIND